MPAAGRRLGDRRRGRAALPELQGDHGRQVEAGRRRSPPPTSASTPVGWAGAGQQIVDVAAAPEREAGEIVEDDGEGYLKIVAFLDEPQGHLSAATRSETRWRSPTIWVFAAGRRRRADVGDPRAADQGPRARRRRSRPSSAATPTTSPRRSASTAPPRCTPPATSAGTSPASPAAAAMQAVIAGGDVARPHPVPAELRRPRRRRAGCRSSSTSPVLTNNVDLAVDGDAVDGHDAGVRRHHSSSPPRFTGPGPYLVAVPPEVASPPRRGGGAAPRSCAAPVPDLGAAGAAKVMAVARRGAHRARSSTRPNIVVSGGRGLGEAGKYEMIETLAKAAEGRARRLAGDRRRRLGAVLATRSARPARSSSRPSTSPPASPAPPSTWWA